jgi:protein-S-isoprenylcysteine O-methyltransferase Ste14
MKSTTTAKIIVRGVVLPLFLMTVMLVAAGRLSYWQGWAYCASLLLVLGVNLFLMRHKRDLIEERLSPGQGTKWWDKVYFSITTPLYIITLVLAALDVGKFHWSPSLPIWAYALSWAAYAVGNGIHFWAKATNRWFATVVRIQTDRGQMVCDTGPYRFVRHPGYTGGILFTIATPLVLGSLVAVIPQAIAAALLVARTYLEDATLRAELPGYAEYAKRVRSRLLPLRRGARAATSG